MRYPLSRLSVLALLFLAGRAVRPLLRRLPARSRGAVRDANGVIPGVTVELINEATNVASRGRLERRRPLQLRGRAPRHLHREGLAHRLQELRAEGHPRRRAAVRDDRRQARSRRAAGNDHRHRRSAADRHLHGVDRRGHQHRAAGRRCRAAAVRRSCSPSPCRPSSPRATRSSTASRTRPTRRCCRSAAARAAATTTWSTACRSPTCATAPRPTPPSKASRT